MGAPPKCPACGCQLQPDWDSCPSCPMSFRDAAPQKTATESDTFRNIVMPLVFFGGLAFAIWQMGSFLWSNAAEGTKGAADAVIGTARKTSSSGGQTPAELLAEAERAEVARNAAAAAKAAGGEQPSGERPAGEPAGEPGEEEGTISIMETKTARAKPVTEWKMRGVIYDLVTLKPIPGAQMIFTDNETNSRAQIQADSQGRYRTILPPLSGGGYIVTISKPGYAKAYLNPGTEGVSEMSLERRKELTRELSSAIVDPASIQPDSSAPLVTDFHLAPQ